MQNPLGLSLVELLLSEQSELTAVERFSQWHDDRDAESPPLQAEAYQHLIPASAPGAGQQYAFRVDLDACTGCKACVTACHSLNGLETDETWRRVGVLVPEPIPAAALPTSVLPSVEALPAPAALQTVTTACHHCEDPACLNGCPVRAYDKDPITGIVKHLDDQCIGCRYCQLKCPYDVPQYSETLGIVRKCDMCSDRLAADEAPACVQGCPNEAISIAVVPTAAGEALAPPELLPLVDEGMPDPAITRPTTRYVSERPELAAAAARWQAGDHSRIEPAEAHDPLAVMLVLVQLSLGLVLFSLPLVRNPGLFGPAAVASIEALRPYIAVAALGAAGLGQLAATAHLGRPQWAFRAVLGWRTSWMSREILAFGAYLGVVGGWAACEVAAAFGASVGLPDALVSAAAGLRGQAILAALAMGVVGTICSIMIYVDTRRAWWSLSSTGTKFFGSALVLGPLGVGCVALVAAAVDARIDALEVLSRVGAPAALLGVCGAVAKLAFERGELDPAESAPETSLGRSARLILGPLYPVAKRRIQLGLLGGVALPAVLFGVALLAGHPGLAIFPALPLAVLGLVFAATGELFERHLFFRASAARAMPGE